MVYRALIFLLCVLASQQGFGQRYAAVIHVGAQGKAIWPVLFCDRDILDSLQKARHGQKDYKEAEDNWYMIAPVILSPGGMDTVLKYIRDTSFTAKYICSHHGCFETDYNDGRLDDYVCISYGKAYAFFNRLRLALGSEDQKACGEVLEILMAEVKGDRDRK